MEEKCLETEYGRVVYERSGAADDGCTPVVLLHGRAVDSAMWESLKPSLAGRAIVAVDLPCHGRSRPYEWFHYDRAAFHVRSILLAERIDRAVIVGHSLGGAVAQAFAAAYPEQTVGLLVADAGPLDRSAYSRIDRFVLKHAASSVRVSAERSPRKLAKEMAKECCATNEGRRTLQALFSKCSDEQLCQLVGIADDELARYLERREAPCTPRCPTMLVVGEKDRVNKTARRMRAWASQTQLPLRELAGAGHFSLLDAPEAFASCVADLLDTVRSTA